MTFHASALRGPVACSWCLCSSFTLRVMLQTTYCKHTCTSLHACALKEVLPALGNNKLTCSVLGAFGPIHLLCKRPL